MGAGGRQPLFQAADRLTVAAFTAAVCGLLLAGVPFLGVGLSVAAVVMAQASRRRSRHAEEEPHRVATLGALGGVAGILLGGAFTTVFVVLLAAR